MTVVLFILVTIFQLLFGAFIIFLCIAFVTGGPFVPSTPKSVEAMIALAHLKPGMTIYDVGSGDGRVLFAAAQKGARAVGIEINPYLVLYTRLKVFFSPYRGKIHVIWGDLWRTDVSKANLVFVYLIPWRMGEFATKLTRELTPGSTVVSNSFIFPGWKSLRSDPRHHIYAFHVS